MNKTSKRVIIVLASLLVLFFIVKRVTGSAANGQVKVSVEKAANRTIIETVNASGKIYPETEVKISPESSGRVTELKISEGDYVKKGQVLARIANRSAVEAPMDGIISSLRIKKGESVAGNTFNVGTEMMTVADMSVLELRVDVGESDIIKVVVGDSADVAVDAYDNRKFKGVVTQIASSTKSAAMSMSANDVTNYEVRIRLDATSYKDLVDSSNNNKVPFRRGMNASADIKTKKVENTLTVPITAVNARVKGSDMSMEDKKKEDKENKGEENSGATNTDVLEDVVFVLQPDGTIKKVAVKSGIQDLNCIQIISGLSAGDEVVTGPYSAISKTLKEGMKVKVVTKDKLFEK